MGLSNQYVGEAKYVGSEPARGSARWFHRWANKQRGMALTEDEAAQISAEFKEKVKRHSTVLCAADLTPDELDAIAVELYEAEAIGRMLETDEEEYLEENENYAVIDI